MLTLVLLQYPYYIRHSMESSANANASATAVPYYIRHSMERSANANASATAVPYYIRHSMERSANANASATAVPTTLDTVWKGLLMLTLVLLQSILH